ncbi:LOB domain-containing protein 25-like [Salvia hispanica]|uniref:LOB domain-containing protein 25-like n=1 Tax=Salvia hispanica TaxID=49212 RepID=UPI002009ADBF|nr:LOB domain-containing protein 25-like [Salvia hispanica]
MTPRCGACKCLKRKCAEDCPLAPYFPAENPKRFSNVDEVFGGSNVAKVLTELDPSQREAAANSLAYEAEHLLRDPIHSYLRHISNLKQQIDQIHAALDNSKTELATYIDPSAHQQQQQQQRAAQEKEITAIGSYDASDHTQFEHEHDRLDSLFLQQLQQLQDYFEAQQRQAQIPSFQYFVAANVFSSQKGREIRDA